MALPLTYRLAEAQQAGLTWRMDGDEVVLRGPRSAETIVIELMTRREELKAFLRPRPCADCGQPCGSATRCSPCAAQRVEEWRARQVTRAKPREHCDWQEPLPHEATSWRPPAESPRDTPSAPESDADPVA